MRRGRLFAFSRFFVRRYIGRWQADVPERQGPAVYVCSHTNLLGPLAALCWLPFPVRPWVYHVFMEKGSCRAQYRDFTFPKRFGMPGPLAGFCAWASAGYVSRLMASLGGIPVYRGSRRIIETFRETIAALQAGDPVLIFPDVDYTDEGAGIGAVYNGFLKLDRFWSRVSSAPLDFVPLRLEAEERRIVAGPAVRFDRAADRREELVRVREARRREINRANLSAP